MKLDTKMSMRRKVVRAYVNESQYNALKEYSRIKGVSMSGITKLAIAEYLERRGVTVSTK